MNDPIVERTIFPCFPEAVLRTLAHCTVFTLIVLSMVCLPAGVSAQPPDVTPPDGSNEASQDDDDGSSQSFVDILVAGGPVGVLIILLSVGAMALVIEHVLTIRAGVLIPPGLDEEVHDMLAGGKVGQASQHCRMEPSFLGYVLGAGLGEVDGGWQAVEKAVEDATAEQSARLFRKIEYLSVIGAIAPMLGLLGTVIGMIFAFRELSTSQGAPLAADLAEGIYLALITTVEGLIVAIPALAAFAVFRNRVDHLVAEVTYVAQHVLMPLKRKLMAVGALPVASRDLNGPAPPPVAGGR